MLPVLLAIGILYAVGVPAGLLIDRILCGE